MMVMRGCKESPVKPLSELRKAVAKQKPNGPWHRAVRGAERGGGMGQISVRLGSSRPPGRDGDSVKLITTDPSQFCH